MKRFFTTVFCALSLMCTIAGNAATPNSSNFAALTISSSSVYVITTLTDAELSVYTVQTVKQTGNSTDWTKNLETIGSVGSATPLACNSAWRIISYNIGQVNFGSSSGGVRVYLTAAGSGSTSILSWTFGTTTLTGLNSVNVTQNASQWVQLTMATMSSSTNLSGTTYGVVPNTGSLTSTPTIFCVVIPIELTSFKSDKGLLLWTTASEVNVSYFEIQTSLDGKSFDKVGEIMAKGSNSTYSFSLNDTRTTITYFRLRSVDNDGTFKFSNIISTESKSGDKFEVKVVGNGGANPYLHVTSEKPVLIEFVNVLGQTITSTSNINAPIPDGAFAVRVWDKANNKPQTTRVSKF